MYKSNEVRMFAIGGLLAMGAVAAILAAPAHADVFVKVKGAPGDAVQRGFEQQINVSGASMNVSSMPEYGPDGEVLPSRTPSGGPVYLSKTPDRSSPKLMQAALKGDALGTVEITFTTSKPGVGQMPQYKWILEGVHINGFSVNPGASPGESAQEMMELSYTSMRYQWFSLDPKTGRTVSTEEVNWTAPEAFPFGLHDGDCG